LPPREGFMSRQRRNCKSKQTAQATAVAKRPRSLIEVGRAVLSVHGERRHVVPNGSRQDCQTEPLPPTPSPKRRGGERQLLLPLSAAGRGWGRGVPPGSSQTAPAGSALCRRPVRL